MENAYDWLDTFTAEEMAWMDEAIRHGQHFAFAFHDGLVYGLVDGPVVAFRVWRRPPQWTGMTWAEASAGSAGPTALLQSVREAPWVCIDAVVGALHAGAGWQIEVVNVRPYMVERGMPLGMQLRGRGE